MNWSEVYGCETAARVAATADSAGLDAAAALLYDENNNRASCPAWDMLGDVTRSVWRERAMEVILGGLA